MQVVLCDGASEILGGYSAAQSSRRPILALFNKQVVLSIVIDKDAQGNLEILVYYHIADVPDIFHIDVPPKSPRRAWEAK